MDELLHLLRSAGAGDDVLPALVRHHVLLARLEDERRGILIGPAALSVRHTDLIAGVETEEHVRVVGRAGIAENVERGRANHARVPPAQIDFRNARLGLHGLRRRQSVDRLCGNGFGHCRKKRGRRIHRLRRYGFGSDGLLSGRRGFRIGYGNIVGSAAYQQIVKKIKIAVGVAVVIFEHYIIPSGGIGVCSGAGAA